MRKRNPKLKSSWAIERYPSLRICTQPGDYRLEFFLLSFLLCFSTSGRRRDKNQEEKAEPGEKSDGLHGWHALWTYQETRNPLNLQLVDT